jgi:hypothetical protein
MELCTCRRLVTGGARDIVGGVIHGSMVGGFIGFLVG